mgnify:CR=1 FL=1
MLKVVLLCDVPGKGKKNDVISVADGFAQNFLLKQKKAVLATTNALKKIETGREEEERKILAEKEKNKALAEKINGLKLEISAESKNGKLFGTIGVKDIQEALQKKDFDIEKKFINIENPIKQTGEFEIDLKFDAENQAKISLMVI